SASIAEVAAMSDSVFCKRFRFSYESSPSSSPPDIPSWKCSRGSNSYSKNAEDEGPTVEDGGPSVGDEGLAAGDEGLGMRVESLSLGGDKAVPE
ncbi:hypothetical protein Tco_0426605, partial [Tanacetum coccineum]